MSEMIHSKSDQRMFRDPLQSAETYRNGQRIFIVPDNGGHEWNLGIRVIRIKTALNYWRNGYKWRASWILAQR